MKVTKISLKNYRNLKDTFISPDEGINVIFGDNAQGKTNLLEAIWLFSGNRSFRNTKDSEQINFSQHETELYTEFVSSGRLQTAKINISRDRKKVYLNSVPQNSTATLLGIFNTVVFSPDHLSLVKGQPSERRKFVDTAICQLKPIYAKVLSEYHKTLIQRNALVKDITRHAELLDTLDIWDEKLAKCAATIINYRHRFIKRLSNVSKNIYTGISKQKESLAISYSSIFQKSAELNAGDLSEEVSHRLKTSRREDFKNGFTTIGPHRDDVEFTINGEQAKTFASQGQQRSIVLSSKLAEATILQEKAGHRPVILLDDVMSELDTTRQDYILNNIKDWQVFITCCEATTVMRLLKGKAFKVSDGEVSEY